jgi:hypothetical protein
MLPFGVTIPATVPQRSDILEGLTKYPVYVDGIEVVTMFVTLLN